MAEVEEAELAVAAARQTGLPVVACMVFDSGSESRPHDDGRDARSRRRSG